MPGKTPDKEPVENGGYRGGKDIDMTDKDLKPKGKKSIKEGDDEMTVVVPPSKASKQSSAPPPNDADGDVAMDDSGKAEDGEVKVDPIVQAINGMSNASLQQSQQAVKLIFLSSIQISKAILHCSTVPLPSLTLDSHYEPSDPSLPFASG